MWVHAKALKFVGERARLIPWVDESRVDSPSHLTLHRIQGLGPQRLRQVVRGDASQLRAGKDGGACGQVGGVWNDITRVGATGQLPPHPTSALTSTSSPPTLSAKRAIVWSTPASRTAQGRPAPAAAPGTGSASAEEKTAGGSGTSALQTWGDDGRLAVLTVDCTVPVRLEPGAPEEPIPPPATSLISSSAMESTSAAWEQQRSWEVRWAWGDGDDWLQHTQDLERLHPAARIQSCGQGD